MRVELRLTASGYPAYDYVHNDGLSVAWVMQIQ